MKKATQTSPPPPQANQAGFAQRLLAFWLAPVQARPVRVFECLFTLTFLIWMGRCFLTWEEWLTEAGFHLSGEELRSMGYPAPWPLLEVWQVPCLAALILGGSALVLLNRWRRAGLAVLFLCALYVQRADYMAAFTLNKLYVGIYALLAAGPGMMRDEKTGKLLQSATVLRVLQATLVLQYFAAGLAKLDGHWLEGHDILWTQVQGVYRTEAAAWALRNLPLWTWAVQQHLSLAFEAGAPLLFLLPRLRPVALVLGIGFHVVITLMMKDLLFFSLQMWAFYVLFLPAGWLGRLPVGGGMPCPRPPGGCLRCGSRGVVADVPGCGPADRGRFKNPFSFSPFCRLRPLHGVCSVQDAALSWLPPQSEAVSPKPPTRRCGPPESPPTSLSVPFRPRFHAQRYLHQTHPRHRFRPHRHRPGL